MLITPTPIVKQRGEQDCYLCCFCMALGFTYEELTQRLGSEFVGRISVTGVTCKDDLDRCFSSLGLEEDVGYRRVFCHSIAEWPSRACSAIAARSLLWGRRAMVQVKSVNYEGKFHIVYWNGFSLFDPSNKNLVTWASLEPLYIIIFNERAPALARAALALIEDADDAS